MSSFKIKFGSIGVAINNQKLSSDASIMLLLPQKFNFVLDFSVSVFNIVRFKNDICDGGAKNGSCYTSDECSSRGGTNEGSCASGYGVCCVFTLSCGETSSENCTFFDSSSPVAGACSVEICPCNGNICQLRLDFTSFVITGPQTSIASAVKTKNGAISNSANALAQTLATQCLTDTFSVTGGGATSPSPICGVNTGQHMYVDADPNCNDLIFQLASASGTNQPSLATRSWSIKVNQYSCNFENLAPSGCTQYFFDTSNAGTISSYNFNGGATTAAGAGFQLANQQTQFCVRRESGTCRICYFTVTNTDFDVSGRTGDMALVSVSACCGYGANAEGTKGFDCIQIPGAMTFTDRMLTPSNICGMTGLATETSAAASVMAPMTVCSTQTPFVLRYLTDAYEGAVIAAEAESANLNRGFMLSYALDAINCAPN